MKFKIAVCDDEQSQIEYLTSTVNEWAKINSHIAEMNIFRSAEAFLFEYGENQTFDILLLDIEMGKMNGIELAKLVRAENKTVQMIFITGYPDFISVGYEVSALHYLMKPAGKEKLFEVLDRAAKNIGVVKKSVLLETSDGTVKLYEDEITYIEVMAHYSDIHTLKNKYTARITLGALLKELDTEAFIQIHRSFAVNLQAVSRITKTDVILDSGEAIPLSRRLYGDICNAFIAYYGRE